MWIIEHFHTPLKGLVTSSVETRELGIYHAFRPEEAQHDCTDFIQGSRILSSRN